MGSARPHFVRLPSGELLNVANILRFRLGEPGVREGKPVATGWITTIDGSRELVAGRDAAALDAYLALTGAAGSVPDVPLDRSGYPAGLTAIDDVA